MNLLNFSSRVSHFVDAADVGGNIKNNRLNLQYLNMIDNACKKAGITTGAVYPFVGGNAISHSFNFLNSAQFQISWNGTVIHDALGVKNGGGNTFGNTNLIPSLIFSIDNTCIIYSLENTNASFSIGARVDLSQEMVAEKNGIISLSSHQYTSYGGGNGIQEVVINPNSSSVVMSKLETDHTIAVNSGLYNSTTRNGGTLPNIPLYILANNVNSSTNTPNTVYQRLIGFTNGVDKSKCSQLRHDIYIAQRSLGRAS